jgi:hypothetical protein
MPNLRYFISVLFLLLPLANARGAEPTVIHVSTQGDDAADGSSKRPLASLATAQDQARAALGAGAKQITVQIAAGHYVLNEPLRFTPADAAASSDGSVTYAAVGDVQLSGGQKIVGWRAAGNRWVTKLSLDRDLPPFRDLWVNGRRAVRARTPNDGYFRIDKAGADNRTSFTTTAADFIKLAAPQTAEVAFLHDWSMSRIRLASIDSATHTYKLADPIGASAPQFAITNFEEHPRYFLENAPELLDDPGEWLLNEKTGELSYIPREGETPDKAEVVAPRLDQLLIIHGEADKPVENLTFSGLAFVHARYDIPAHGYVGVQGASMERRTTADDHDSAKLTPAILIDGVRNCRFTNCRFEHLAASGIEMFHAQRATIDHCQFRDIGGNGLDIGSTGAEESPHTESNSVENCLFENCGVNFAGAVGLWIGLASDTTVAHNELRNLPYTGVSVGWRWDDSPSPCRGNKLSENHIHHVMQALSDGGGIYTLGRQPGTRLFGNLIHDVPLNAGRAESNGIFMDEGSTDIVVLGNTIYNVAKSAIRFHRAGKNTIEENRLATPPGVPAFAFNACDASVMVFKDNREISAADWQPSADDPAVNAAGRR